MRTQFLLILGAAIIVAVIIATASQLNVTLNEAGTDVIAVDLSGLAQPKQAIAAQQR
jgi:hypothetical protein